MESKVDLRNLTLDEAKELARELGQPAFRGEQIFSWVQKGVATFDEMANLPKDFRRELSERADLSNMKVEKVQVSKKDGTRKYLFELSDGNRVESVFMKYSYGNSICISSQVGCAMGCKFCASTKEGLVRNLTAGEMIGQVFEVEREAGEDISRVVVMGIGEPFENYDSLAKFIDIIHDEKGHYMSMRNITISTCGLVEMMERFGEEYPQINLALSLHGPNQKLRESLMPIARKYDLAQLMEACRKHTEKTGRRITFEYALIDGVNDGEECARELADLLEGMLCHVNLIPLNRVEGNPFKGSDEGRVREISDYLEKRGVQVTVRRKLGEDIDAACGQLRLRRK